MKKNRRVAKSLVELLVVMSVMSVVLALCATSMATLFRLRSQLSRDREQGAALARLGMRLRQDAHEATAVALEDAACGFTLADGRAVQYAFAATHIVREVKRGETIAHRDRFTLPKSAMATFERDGDAPDRLVRLLIRPIEVPTRRVEIPRVATIEAAIGLNTALAAGRRQP